MSFFNKIGRRVAGTWGRPRRSTKKISSRAIRRFFKNSLIREKFVDMSKESV